ncbi:MAG: hypothetical protein PHS31_11485, partial [Victivallaceae bacterium]|nr:hypothetical protein [Victivallaceae bacterium]
MRRKQQYFKTKPNDPIPVSVEVRHRLAFSEVDTIFFPSSRKKSTHAPLRAQANSTCTAILPPTRT